jgi:hypothetical protein
MTKEVIDRQASDNEYLHKDFHGALSAGIEYLHKNYGKQAVIDYLRQFALVYYSPLKKSLDERGLIAVKEYYEKIHQIEGGKIEITLSDDELSFKIDACPAVMHMREKGYSVAELFHETTKTVNEAICEGSEFDFDLVEYDSKTGRSLQRFYRRSK